MSFRLFCRVLGSAALLGAVASLFVPLALHVVDRSSQRITCGTGILVVLERAAAEDEVNWQWHLARGNGFAASDYTGECESLIAERRAIALQVAAVGVVIGLVTLYRPRTRRPARHALLTSGQPPVTAKRVRSEIKTVVGSVERWVEH
jgi:chloramphenicol 3-O-phosphotransferase